VGNPCTTYQREAHRAQDHPDHRGRRHRGHVPHGQVPGRPVPPL